MVIKTNLTFLQGPGIDGSDIQISLEQGTPLNPERLENVLSGAKRAAEKEKQAGRNLEIKNVGDMRVMEEQRAFSSTTNPSQQLIDWKVTYFVRRDIDYAPYVINIIGMTNERLDRSRELLRKIIDSIQYEPR